MKLDVEQYLCTTCGDYFQLDGGVEHEDGNVRQGKLVCLTCGVSYQVIDGIPRFVSGESYANSFGFQWNIHRKTQLDSYTGLAISRRRLFSVSGWSDRLEGERILEAGSGAGRFTEILVRTGADVFSFDYSNAVEANRGNNGGVRNLHLFQCDIFNIPLPQESFDKVICLGVLQHTRDPEHAFKNLAKYVKPSGELVVDIYRASLVSWLQWKYLLRPLAKRMNRLALYELIAGVVPILIPFARVARTLFGRVGARILPIVEYTHLGLQPGINREWAILDTFDMYSPAYDQPQTLRTVERWFRHAGLTDVVVTHGPNGIVGKGRKPTLVIDKAAIRCAG